jgi:hypothetical protein
MRRSGLDHLYARLRSSHWPQSLTRPRRVIAVAGVAAALVLSLVGVAMAGVFAGTGTGTQAAGAHAPRAAGHSPAATSGGHASSGPASSPPGAPARKAADGTAKAAAPARPRASAPARTRALVTSCRSVAHIGDSTSVGMVSPDYLPDPAQRLAARYADVGVRYLRVDASGGRSIVEKMPGQVNGYGVASAWRSEGYRGCWVYALGTNDTANVSVGSSVGLMGRVEQMMSAAHGEPVMWVNVRTMLGSGPWSEANMQTWNNTLLQACARYPNMRILDWASVANPGWFISDGIHYTPAGFADRAQAIADGLARAFPRGGHSNSCVVR